MKTALFIGRFQPFHKGHEHAINFILKDKEIDKIIIGIGSINKNDENNPYSFLKRKKMIKKSIDKIKNNIKNKIKIEKKENDLKIKIKKLKELKIIGIPDFQDDEMWFNFIKENVNFDVVFSNNKKVKDIFLNRNILIKKIPFKNKKNYNGKNIRKKMKKEKIISIKDLVNNIVYEILKKNFKK